MPANLTPDYERAEQRYREAQTDEDRLTSLREMYATIPKHKGTEKLQADLKRKISTASRTIQKRPAKGPDPFHVPRSGAGQVVLIGAPNVGKSALVGRLTHAPVKVADYPFTTAVPVPGMVHHQDVQIELVDTPPITPDHIPPGLLNTIRNADIIAVVVEDTGEALDEAEGVLSVLSDRGLVLRTARANEIDPTHDNERPALMIASKMDRAEPGTLETLRELYGNRLEVLATSAETGAGLDALVARLWDLLALVRVYTKQPGKPADKVKPFTLPTGSTVEDLAAEIHRELPGKMTFAKLWREAKYTGQQVHRTEELHDGDVVEIHE